MSRGCAKLRCLLPSHSPKPDLPSHHRKHHPLWTLGTGRGRDPGEGGLTVEVEYDRRLIQRGEVKVEVFPGEIRHTVNALAEAAARLVDQQEESDS
jgi:hypothetical protein